MNGAEHKTGVEAGGGEGWGQSRAIEALEAIKGCLSDHLPCGHDNFFAAATPGGGTLDQCGKRCVTFSVTSFREASTCKVRAG